MNRQPYTKPPRWWSPKASRFWMGFWRPMRWYQQLKHERILHVGVRGLEHVERAINRRFGVLITPNHPGHADCYLLWEALTRLPQRCYVMTAWQVFQMGRPLETLIWRQHGCFSVDREGTDLTAFRFSVDVLANTSSPLVIFPEGDVYHLNERVTPFRDGVGGVAHAAVKQGRRPVACVPCALKYEYIRDPSPELRQVMSRLEARHGLSVGLSLPLEERIHRFASHMLALKERQYLGVASSGRLNARFEHLADRVLAKLEAEYTLIPRDATVPERVKEIRKAVIARQRELVTDDPQHGALAAQMEDLFFAVQLFSYYGSDPTDYVAQRPTVERLAETIDKFEEDFLGAKTATVRGLRRGLVEFGEPLLITQAVPRRAARELPQQLERRVQALLDHQALSQVALPSVGQRDDTSTNLVSPLTVP